MKPVTSHDESPAAANALFLLGLKHLQGDGAPQNYDKAMEAFLEAARLGQHAAEFNIGSMYLHGAGVACDPERALEWYTKAAHTGDPDLLYNIGQTVESAHAQLQAWPFAIKCYMAAANGGLAEAQAMLAVRFIRGKGVPEDKEIGMRYLDAAVKQGHPSALGFLGRLQEHGDLGPRNQPLAAYLYYLAAFYGHPEAKTWGTDLMNRMSAIEQHEAAQLISDFKERVERENAQRAVSPKTN